jgi:succinate---hydroxymethylglutarate CoA-transferase
MQAEAGFFSLTGEPDTPPARFGLSIIDQMTGVTLAYALLAGVLSAQKTGEGRNMDVSLFDVALSNLAYPAIWYLNEGHVVERLPRSGHPVVTPCQLYKTGDGWVYIMCNKEKFWPALCDVLGRPDWAADERFATFKDRTALRPLVQEMIEGELAKKTTAEWMEAFAGKVPASPVNDVRQAMENPYVKDYGRLRSVKLEGYGEYRTLAGPVKSSGAQSPDNPAPKLGADTQELLSGIGYDAERLAALREKKVIG